MRLMSASNLRTAAVLTRKVTMPRFREAASAVTGMLGDGSGNLFLELIELGGSFCVHVA